jgi:aryl-alcohol dehydrogenase-like predicted oxidoreductase
VTIYEPLANGLLTDVPFHRVRDRWASSPWQDATVYPELMCLENAEPMQHVIDGLRTIAQQLNLTIAQVALAWVLAQPGVSSALVGSSNPDRVRSNATSGDLVLSEDVLQTIDHELIPLTAQFAPRN